MKYSIFLFVLLITFSCGHNSHSEEASDDTEWKEMEEFHTVMADVYHPLKDSNNLEPIKKDAGNLSAAASKWADAKVPEKVDNEETRKLLTQLKDGTQELAQAVKSGDSDEIIAAKLTILHDTFHSIMESWYKAGKEEGAEEHHDH